MFPWTRVPTGVLARILRSAMVYDVVGWGGREWTLGDCAPGARPPPNVGQNLRTHGGLMPDDPWRIVLRTLRSACYGLCAMGIGGAIAGRFIADLSTPTLFALVTASLLFGAIGLILDLLLNMRWQGEKHADS